MADREAHLEQARNNRKVAVEMLQRGIDTGENVYLQWAVTAAFYCSVHCIEAHLSTLGLHSQHHGDRDTKLGEHCPNYVYTAHNALRDFSTEARYLLATFTPTWVRMVVLEKYLGQVSRFVHLEPEPPGEPQGASSQTWRVATAPTRAGHRGVRTTRWVGSTDSPSGSRKNGLSVEVVLRRPATAGRAIPLDVCVLLFFTRGCNARRSFCTSANVDGGRPQGPDSTPLGEPSSGRARGSHLGT